MEAHGHAARDDAQACGVALAQAERTFDRAAREDDPAWLAYFDEAYLAARMAQCFRDLGEAGHSARYARRSLDMDGRYVRGRAFNLSLLATAHAAQGEPEQACVVGRQALDLTVRLTSARSVRYVRDLVAGSGREPVFPAVRDFTAEVWNASRRSRTCWTPMTVIAPRMSPLAIMPGVSSTGTHRTSAARQLRALRLARLRALGTGPAGSRRCR